MKGVNMVVLVGNLGKDPEIKYTQSGTAVCNFSMATTDSRKDKGGQTINETEWHNCVAFGKTGEVIAQYMTKGSGIYVRGKIRTNSWEDKEGNKRETKQIVVNEVTFLGGGKKNEGGQQQSRPTQQRPAPQQQDDFGGADELTDDDIPF